MGSSPDIALQIYRCSPVNHISLHRFLHSLSFEKFPSPLSSPRFEEMFLNICAKNGIGIRLSCLYCPIKIETLHINVAL